MSVKPHQDVFGAQLLVKTREKVKVEIWVVLFGHNGRKTNVTRLNHNGQSSVFPVSLMEQEGTPLGETTEIELWREDSKDGSDWFCDVITLFDMDTGRSMPFPVQRWIQRNFRYRIRAYDTCLPQDDPYPDQRKLDLGYKGRIYRPFPLLYQIESERDTSDILKSYTIPGIENYPNHILKERANILFKSIKIYFKTRAAMFSGDWKTFADFDKAFCDDDYCPLPKCSKFWQNDEWFAAMRLMGQNPTSIKLCTEIPENFLVVDTQVGPLLEGDTLESLITEKRLFIIDLAILKDVSTVKIDGKPLKMVAPLALFFLNKNRTLMPLAIQLNQKPGYDNPIFTPLDDKNIWTLAKMWFGNADANYQAVFVHLARTHFVMESAGGVTHRNLAPNHPVFRLLAPHFHCTMAIDNEGLYTLLSPGGMLDSITTLGRGGGFEVIKRGWTNYRFDVQGTIGKDLEDRGVMDSEILPNFPYRDDGMLIYNCIKSYVENVLKIYYGDDPCAITNDDELKNWGRQLGATITQGGGGIKFDMYSYLPNMPLRLVGNPPTNKNKVSEEDLMKQLPDKHTIVTTILAMQLLSTNSYKTLGFWDVRFQYDPRALEVERKYDCLFKRPQIQPNQHGKS